MSIENYRQFLVLYKQYFDKIYQFVYYRTGRSRETAEDLTSEIFLKALEHFSEYDESIGTFNSWIYRIAQNHITDYYRTNRATISLEDASNVAEETHMISEKMKIKEQYEYVLRSIQSLPEGYQEILILKYINQYSNEEIGEIMNKSQGSIRVTLHRAIKALIDKLNLT